MIGDFGVPIALFIMVAIDVGIEDVHTQVRKKHSSFSDILV